MRQVQSICTATERCVTKVNYKLHGKLPFLKNEQISIQSKNEDKKEAENQSTFKVHGEYTQTTRSLPWTSSTKVSVHAALTKAKLEPDQ